MALNKEDNENRRSKASRWLSRWKAATTHFEEWERTFKCRDLAKYYEGKQYDEDDYPDGMDPLVFNLFYSAVESRLPSMSFVRPVAEIKAKPSKMDFEPDAAVREARLRSDMVNTFLTDPDNAIGDICEQAIIDAQFYFGVVEVGYSASWVDNPSAPKPILPSDESDDYDTSANEDETEAVDFPEEERIYVKHIPPRNFRIGGNSKFLTHQSAWCGYLELYRLEDLLAIPEFKRRLDFEDLTLGLQSSDFVTQPGSDEKAADLVECLVLFDLRRKLRLFISKTHGILLQEVPFKRLPLFPLRFSKTATSHGWYPVPPAKAWKTPQDEYNDARRAMSHVRKRALPKWLVNNAMFPDEEEQNKLTSAVPFTVSSVNGDPSAAISEVPFGNLPAEFGNSIVLSRDEFNHAAGTSLDVANSADRETATKSKIVATRAGVRESRTLGIVANWLSTIVREITLLQADHFTLETWVKRAVDSEPTLAEIQEIESTWERIDPTRALSSDFDFTCTIDVASLSPVYREEQKNSLLEFLAIINQYPQFAFSPKLLRYLADMLNIRTESVLRELQQLALVAQLGLATQAQGAMDSAMAQRTVAKATPSQGEQVNNQLKNQVGLPSE